MNEDAYLEAMYEDRYGPYLDESFDGWDEQDEQDDSMDGDHASALASVGWGTEEDYGTIVEDMDVY